VEVLNYRDPDCPSIHQKDHAELLTNRQAVSLWTVLAFLMLAFACKNSPDVNADDLTGHWVIAKAERNGRPSEYLDRGYFTFTADGQLTVNLTGTEEKGGFRLADGSIRMDGHRDYQIDRYAPDSLFLQFSTNPESIFRILLIKEDEANR
jgi:hypothetical protein